MTSRPAAISLTAGKPCQSVAVSNWIKAVDDIKCYHIISYKARV